MQEISRQNYWSKSEIVEEFKMLPVPAYWEEYFAKLQGTNKFNVLDLGCGGGRNSEMLYRKGFNLYACDLHFSMVSITQNRLADLQLNSNYQVIQANMLDLPYSDMMFDVILANGVFHNVSDAEEIKKALMEAKRVLKPTGEVCLNIFTNFYIDDDLTNIKDNLFVNKDGLEMTLLSSSELLFFIDQIGLFPKAETVEYISCLSVGKRSVLRGIFAIKK